MEQIRIEKEAAL